MDGVTQIQKLRSSLLKTRNYQRFPQLNLEQARLQICVFSNQQTELIALGRQGTQQQGFESPTVTPHGMQANAGYINSTKHISSKIIRGFTLGGVYVLCIYSHAKWSYRRRFKSLLLCPCLLSAVNVPMFVHSTQALWA